MDALTTDEKVAVERIVLTLERLYSGFESFVDSDPRKALLRTAFAEFVLAVAPRG